MAGEEIEWLDEPVLPGRSDESLRRRRRPVVLVVGVLGAVAAVTGALLTGRGDREAEVTPSAVTTVASAESLSPVASSLVFIPDASPGLLRAVGERFPGADLTSIGGCAVRGGARYGFTARGLTIQLDVGCSVAEQDTFDLGPHRIFVSGSRARVSIASSPRRTLTERDFAAAGRLVDDKRVVS